MREAFSREVTIQPGGVVTVQSPDLPAGARARVVVLLEGPGTEPPPRSLEPADPSSEPDLRPLAGIAGRSRPCFRSAAEVDAFVRRERDAWDS